MAKVQPQYSQAFSNLQLDYVKTTKNLIQNILLAQKQLIGSWNIIAVSTMSYVEQYIRQSNEIANNTLKAVDINNQLAINTLDLARENLRIYNRTVDAVTEFATNIAKVCTAFSTASQQQQFAK
jgi:hypothetical protein